MLAEITVVGKKSVNKVYDPACGSGSLLLKFAKVLGKNNVRQGFYGQEINITTYNLCRINMFLHDINFEKFNIANGDTLTDPKHWDDEPFDCIVSNPPWMAMSKLADNPYNTTLQRIARQYGIKPVGASHPHMELATTFLLSAVNCYLEDGARWSCVMPGSLLSGLNHEPLRSEKYRSSDVALPLQFDAIWELPQNTFKNKAIVLSGKKDDSPSPDVLDGRVYTDVEVYEEVHYTLNRQGNRSAWTNKGRNVEVADILGDNALKFSQGCDLFPRTTLFHEFVERPNGNWDIAPIERTSNLWYLVNDQKKTSCEGLAAENVDKSYIFDAFISKNLSPFYMATPAMVLLH